MNFCISLLVISAVAVTVVNSLPNRFSSPDCSKVCTRMWRPVCATLNGFPVNVSNRCMLDSLIQCGGGARDTKVWEFLHEGPCQNDEMSEAKNAEITHLSENTDEDTSEDTIEDTSEDTNEDSDENDDNKVDEQLNWEYDNENNEE